MFDKYVHFSIKLFNVIIINIYVDSIMCLVFKDWYSIVMGFTEPIKKKIMIDIQLYNDYRNKELICSSSGLGDLNRLETFCF